MGNKLKTVDAETLLSTPMSKTMFIVDGLISQGVNVISGASKIAISYCGLGTPMLPGFGSIQGKVPNVKVVSVCPKPSIKRIPVIFLNVSYTE